MNTLSGMAPRHRNIVDHGHDYPIVDLTSLSSPDMVGMTLYIPLNDAHGHAFTVDQIQRAVAKLVNRFGGATVFPPSNGSWTSPKGQVCEDWVSPVLVVAPNTASTMQAFRMIVNKFAQEFQQ